MARTTSYIHLDEKDQLTIETQGPHDYQPEPYPVILAGPRDRVFVTDKHLIQLLGEIQNYLNVKAGKVTVNA